MTTTQLEQVIQQVVDRSLTATLARHADRVAEEMAETLWKENREEWNALIRVAIQKALANLQQPVTP